jgi:hypothetical protein
MFLILFLKKKLKKKLILFLMGHMTRVSLLRVLTWTSVNFWTDVSSPFLARSEVTFMIQNEPHGAKNKIKLEGGQR